jgi:hypothetical protein
MKKNEKTKLEKLGNNQTPTPPIPIDKLTTFGIPIGLKQKVKKRISEISEKKCSTLAIQVYYLQGEKDIKKVWFLTWEQLGSVFGRDAINIRRFYLKGKKYFSLNDISKVGRPTLLTTLQEEELVAWLDTKYLAKEPPTAVRPYLFKCSV